MDERSRFLDLVQRNPVNVAVLEGRPALDVYAPFGLDDVLAGRERPNL